MRWLVYQSGLNETALLRMDELAYTTKRQVNFSIFFFLQNIFRCILAIYNKYEVLFWFSQKTYFLNKIFSLLKFVKMYNNPIIYDLSFDMYKVLIDKTYMYVLSMKVLKRH